MFGCQGILVSGFVIACELFAAKYRTFAGIIIGNYWAVVMCLYTLLAYLVNNWVHLQLIISLFGILTIPLYWYYTDHLCTIVIHLRGSSSVIEIIGVYSQVFV